MAHGDSEAQGIANPVLQRFFPGAATRAVASASVRQDENLASFPIAQSALVLPPLCDGIHGEGRWVVADADEYRSAVGLGVINAARGGQRFSLGAKIVVVDQFQLAVPLGAGIFEGADQFLRRGRSLDAQTHSSLHTTSAHRCREWSQPQRYRAQASEGRSCDAC